MGPCIEGLGVYSRGLRILPSRTQILSWPGYNLWALVLPRKLISSLHVSAGYRAIPHKHRVVADWAGHTGFGLALVSRQRSPHSDW